MAQQAILQSIGASISNFPLCKTNSRKEVIKVVESESSCIAPILLSGSNKEQVGTEQLSEIYKLMSEKVIENLKKEAIPTDETYRMIAVVQDLNSQMNGQPNRFPYWTVNFSGNCSCSL